MGNNMIKRSRNGCLSCKKLRIKCDEVKPRCEYCVHTRRVCTYPDSVSMTDARGTPDTFSSLKVPQGANRANWDTPQSISASPDGYISEVSDSESILSIYTHEQTRSYNEFVYNQILSNPAVQLSLSKFEFKLLHFFQNFCIHLFSRGIKKDVEKVWKYQVPGLFMKSQLVRNSVFSFAALNLLPLCDLNQMSSGDQRLEYFLESGFGQPLHHDQDQNTTVVFDPALTPTQNIATLHNATTNYFLEAVKLTNTTIGKNMGVDSASKPLVERENASELAVSSVLLYTYLSLQPSKITPLISWDRSEPDFLSITKGIKYTLIESADTLSGTKYAGLFFIGEVLSDPNVPLISRTTFPIIKSLYSDVQSEYTLSDELTSESSRAHEAVSETINELHYLLYRSVEIDTATPVFSWFLLLRDEYRDLIYAKHFPALRLMYVYVSVALLMGFELFKHDNIWLEYLRWYKDHCIEVFGGWLYSMDEALYKWAYEKLLKFTRVKNFAIFDPEFPGCDCLLGE